MLKIILFNLFFAINSTFACSAFCTSGDHPIIGKNYDWHSDTGFVALNPAGLVKTAFGPKRTLSWTSQYESYTFNQYGVEFPNGGINEQGLVIEILWLTESKYPKIGLENTLNELQWIQYNLDTASTLEEVFENANKHTVWPLIARVHYFVCDSQLHCGVIEYINGKAITTQTNSNATLITNSSYADSYKYLSTLKDFGGSDSIPTDYSSLSRFGRLAWNLRHSDLNPFGLLDSVKIHDMIGWQIVYDLKEKIIQFRSDSSPFIKTLKPFQIKGSCEDKRLIANMNSDITFFEKFSLAKNKDLLKRTAQKMKIPVPGVVLDYIAVYPITVTCK